MLTIVDAYFVNKLGMDGPWRLIECVYQKLQEYNRMG